MRLSRAEGNTELTGNVRDQAELQGLLRRVSDLGLTLLEAKVIDDRPERPDRVDGSHEQTGDEARRRSSSITVPPGPIETTHAITAGLGMRDDRSERQS